MVILEFKKEKHDETMHLAHQLKENVCRLVDNIMEAAIVEKHEGHYMHDERRGRMGRRYEGDEVEFRGGYRGGYRGESGYHYPMMYPYEKPYQPNEEFNNRYNY